MRWLVALLVTISPVVADEICGRSASSAVLTVADWSIKPIDDRSNEMVETLVYSGEKPIRMIDGSIRYADVLGGQIGSKAIDRDARIAPGSTYTLIGTWGQFTFERLLEMERTDVTVVACVSAVVYEDGTKEAFGEDADSGAIADDVDAIINAQ